MTFGPRFGPLVNHTVKSNFEVKEARCVSRFLRVLRAVSGTGADQSIMEGNQDV